MSDEGNGESFAAEIADDGGARVVRLSGEIDIGVTPELSPLLVADEDVVVDVSHVSFIDSSGIAALLRAHRSQMTTGHRLLVKGVHGSVSRVFEITGVDSVLSLVAEHPSSVDASTQLTAR
jgi:anti-anti-sigma factor